MQFPTKLPIPITLILLSFAIGCDRGMQIPGVYTPIAPGEEHTEIITIGPYTETCQGFHPVDQQCYLEFNAESQEWEFFYENIQGFDFEPGFIWTLKVRLEDRGAGIQDVGRYAYHLVEIISKEAAPIDERPPRQPNAYG